MFFFLSFLFFSRFASRACCVASLPRKPRNLRFPHVHDVVVLPRKKGKKKKKTLWGVERKKNRCLSQNECRNVPATTKQEGTPLFLFFFPRKDKKRLQSGKKKSLLVHFIIINNETLVWSEKDGGSAFAGGDDGQGDTHYALFSLFTLSLSSRGGVSRVSFVLLESQSHF